MFELTEVIDEETEEIFMKKILKNGIMSNLMIIKN